MSVNHSPMDNCEMISGECEETMDLYLGNTGRDLDGLEKKTVMEVWNLEYRSGIRDITEMELEGIFHSTSLPASSLNSEI